MSWWGKLAGGAFGFMLGGPLGALMGAAFGHQFDSGFKGVMQDEALGVGATERVQTAFFTTTFSIMGYMAKADGHVSQHELQVARQIMDQMQLSADQKKAAMLLFNEGKQPDYPFEAIMKQFRQECARRTNLVQMFLEIMIATAMADGVLHPQEQKLLYQISDLLHFPRQAFEQLLSMVRGQQHYSGAAQGTRKASIKDAYAVLGVKKSATDAEIKKAYRRLMNQHHPDKLVSKGLPEEMMTIAKEKTQEIKAAYDDVKQARGMR
ncbi:MAG: co-chaperone DjlA [Gammaproteobacteria bacterium]|nr:co-chaperone DjlA [Gammaproteobacteria bacterium]